MKNTPDALVIGGGIAGLAAARQLTGAGLRIMLLEARDRLGGRIYTCCTEEYPVELGAEFVHGRPEEIFALAAEAGLPIVPVEGEYRRKANGAWADAGRLMGKVDQLFEKMPASGPDHSFRHYLDHSGAGDEVREQALRYVEGFHAADPSIISVHALVRDARAEEAIDGERQFRMAGGYHSVARAMEERIDGKCCEMAMNAAVTEIHWRPGAAVVRTPAAEFHAPRVIITVPLGVLKSNSIVFSPALPEKQRAMGFLEMGPAVRVTLGFDERFWMRRPEMAGLSFLFTDDPEFPTWWTGNPLSSPLLTAWAAGHHADALRGQNHDAIVHRAVRALARILGAQDRKIEQRVLRAFTHDWQADPFSRGAYSYTAVGGLDAARTLAAPVERTLYFAGEATNFEGHGGTVHGAIATGHRAAREVLESAKSQT